MVDLSRIVSDLSNLHAELQASSAPVPPGEYCSADTFRASLIKEALGPLERASLSDAAMMEPREEDIPY